MQKLRVLMLGALHGASGAQLPAADTLDRRIELERTVAAPPATVYELWTTEAGVRRFFAPAARIELVPGGRYEMIFFPEEDPQGTTYGTAGARLLDIKPAERLVFEWVSFSADTRRGSAAPPYAPPALRSPNPLPTWVEVSFAPDGAGGTLVRLVHHGFRDGEPWEASRRWFQRAWTGVLDRLAALHAAQGARDYR